MLLFCCSRCYGTTRYPELLAPSEVVFILCFLSCEGGVGMEQAAVRDDVGFSPIG